MPRKKSRNSSKTVSRSALTKGYASELSYETKVIITILLLLFIYPLGLVFMWAWMGNWPLWLKLVITIPFFLGILAFFSILVFVGTILTHVRIQNNMHSRKYWQQYTITPIPTLPTTITPSPVTY